MIPWLLQNLSLFAEHVEQRAAGDSRIYLTLRIALATITSLLLVICLGPITIRWLRRNFGERIDSASETLNRLHAEKQGTPTMGGLLMMGAVFVSTLTWGDLTNPYIQIGLITLIGFTALGVMDDWKKIARKTRGLKARQKLFVQIVLGTVVASLLYVVNRDKPNGISLVSPVGEVSLWLGSLFILWSLLVIVGTSNGVNLTDGLDGLASGCVVFVGMTFIALTYLAGHVAFAHYLQIPYISGAGEYSILMGTLVGAVLGFLWFNCYPAQVFMGDTGSLPIGALLALSALITRQEVILIIAGGVFVIETLSVIAQVSWYRLTGKRLIACSPLHNHFVFKGLHEIKIVTRFWISSALLAILGVATLKVQ